jgi:tetratricopeptide (TPR) repeat protein
MIIKELKKINTITKDQIEQSLKSIPSYPLLNNKQKLFVYLYTTNNYSEKTSLKIYEKNVNYKNYKTWTNRYLNQKNVKKAISEYTIYLLGNEKEKLEKRLYDIYYKRAYYDISIFCNDDGSFKPLSEIPKDWHCCIDNLSTQYYGKDATRKVVNYKLCDRDKALDKLDKYIEFSINRQEIKHTFGLDEGTQNKLKTIFSKPIQDKKTIRRIN